jgi:hypothetical protein
VGCRINTGLCMQVKNLTVDVACFPRVDSIRGSKFLDSAPCDKVIISVNEQKV